MAEQPEFWRQRLPDILSESTSVAVIAAGADGVITYFNRGAEILLGYSADELVGKHTPLMFHLACEIENRGQFLTSALGRRVAGLEVFLQCATSGDCTDHEWTYLRKDSVQIPVHVASSAIKDDTGSVAGVVSVAVDGHVEDSAAQLRMVTDNMPGLVSYVDAQQRYRFANPNHAKWIGRPLQAYLGRTMKEVLAADVYDRVRPRVEQVLSGKTVTFDNLWTMEDGRTGRLQVTFVPHFSGEGKVAGFFSLGADITERYELEKEVQERERAIRSLIETAPLGILLADASGAIVAANPKLATMFGYKADELLGHPLEMLLPERVQEKHRGHRSRFFAAPEPRPIGVSGDLMARHKDGHEFPVQIALSSIQANDQRLGVAFVHDVTQRKQQEVRLRALTAQLLAAQEEERRRMARELHDDLTQKIAVFGVELGLLHAQAEDAALRQSLEKLQDRALALSEDVRRLSHELHPAALEHAGLAAALEGFCAEFTRASGITAEFARRGEIPVLPHAVATSLYRVAQEALRNCEKHSGASSVRLTLSADAQGVRLSVIDDGSGFQPNGPAAEAGLGLTSMRERMRLVQGTLEVDSIPGEGTRVEAWVSLNW